jgi:hypothetical protein
MQPSSGPRGSWPRTPRQLLTYQILAVCIAIYIVVVVVLIWAFSDYLFHEGTTLLILGYLVPLAVVVVLFIAYTRSRTRMLLFRPKKKGVRQEPEPEEEEHDDLLATFFTGTTGVLMATKDLRPELAQLHGDLLAGTEKDTLPQINEYLRDANPAYIGSCGDVISKNVVQTDFYPDLIVVDGKTLREDYGAIFPESYEHRTTKNVTGGITREAWLAVRDAIADRKRIILEVVEGEEDLLLIPMVLYAPDNAVMAYGQPPVTDLDPPIPSGAVMVRANDRTAEFARILGKFIRVPASLSSRGR